MATLEDFRKASQELADELEPSEGDILKLAERYCEFKDISVVVNATGEVMSKTTHEQRLDAMGRALKQWIESHGPIHLEGVGTLRLQERNSEVYDVDAIDEITFKRMKALHILRVDNKLLKEHAAKGDILAPKPMEITKSLALVIEKDR